MIAKRDILLYVQKRSQVVRKGFGYFVHGERLNLIPLKLGQSFISGSNGKLASAFRMQVGIEASDHEALSILVSDYTIDTAMDIYSSRFDLTSGGLAEKILVAVIKGNEWLGNIALYKTVEVGVPYTSNSSKEFDEALCLVGLYKFLERKES